MLNDLPKELFDLRCYNNPLEYIEPSSPLTSFIFPPHFSRFQEHYHSRHREWNSLKGCQAEMLTMLAKNGVSFASLEILSDEFAIHLKISIQKYQSVS
jgi:hypothetical protein